MEQPELVMKFLTVLGAPLIYPWEELPLEKCMTPTRSHRVETVHSAPDVPSLRPSLALLLKAVLSVRRVGTVRDKNEQEIEL